MRSPVGRAFAGNSVGRSVRAGLELEDKNVVIPRFHIEARDRDGGRLCVTLHLTAAATRHA